MTRTIRSCPLAATDNQQIDLVDYKGQWVVLYFYPKDATPGCTTEGQNFRDKYREFSALNAVILGVSRDDLHSHQRFKAQQELPFPLLADTQEALCAQFDVIRSKSMYGKPVRGIERSTFLIDPEGVVQCEWRKVKVEGHVEAVYGKLVSLQNQK